MNTNNLFNILNYPLCLEEPRRLTDIFSWQEHIPFAFALVQMVRPRTLVELGTHKGDSYCAFCQAVQTLDLDCSCSAVDSWEGDEEAGFYGPEILEEFRRHHDPLYGSFSRLIKSRFDEARSGFADRSIDVLHIDGLHTYEAVHHDFHSWLPKVSDRGIILFHDIEVRNDDFGVWKLWKELTPNYPNFAFHHCNGLGVLGVGNDLPEDVAPLFGLNEEHKKYVADIFYYLGSRLTIENRLEKEHHQASEAKDLTIQDLTRHGENLVTMMAEKSNHIDSLTEHCRKLAKTIDEFQNENARLRDIEPRLLASFEQNGFLVYRIEELEATIQSLHEHTANLEKVISHPLVRGLRSFKRVLKRRS